MILCSGGAKILQIDKSLRRRQRPRQRAAIAHERDDLGQAPDVDLGLLRHDAAIGIEIERERCPAMSSDPVTATMVLTASSRFAGSRMNRNASAMARTKPNSAYWPRQKRASPP